MRFSPTALALTLVLSLATLSSAITSGIVGGQNATGGKSRPSFMAVATTAVRVAQADTFVVASARDSVTAHAIGYTPWSTSMFNSAVPVTYQAVASNKDSVVACFTGYGDADSTVMAITLQGRYSGSTNATSLYSVVGTGTLTFTSATVQTKCIGFAHPQGLDFRLLGIGQGSTDTSKVSRVQILDK